MSENLFREAERLWHPTTVTMLALRTLIATALPLLVTSSTLQQCSPHSATPHFSPVLDSLQCYNDFTTHIRCTWEEDPLTNLHLSEIKGKSPCVSDGLHTLLASGKTFRSCLYKTKVFTMGSHIFFFNTSCTSKATALNVAQQGKVLTPVNLTVSKAEDGGRVLRWSSPYPLSSKYTLTYQVTYRRHGHDWTVVHNLTSSELVIENTTLLPGYLYEARVRAHGRVGVWSDWSPPVPWMIEEGGVLNLQCVLVETGLSCSWQVKREHAQVLSYHLCWSRNGEPHNCEQCTIAAGELQHSDALVDFTCLVVSSTPELLTVEIRSVPVSKAFLNSLNLNPPRPPTVHMENNDGSWKVTWSKPQISKKVKLSYQVCFRRSDVKAQGQCSNTTGVIYSFVIPSTFLQHQTQYVAQVRSLPSEEYDGKPSNWSEPVYFTTDSAPGSKTFIYILIGVFVLACITLYNALPACHRRLELWKVSIPSPTNSKVLEEIKIRPAVNWVFNSSEKTSVCIMQASDNPIIYKGSILEYPLVPYLDDSRGNITLMKSDWTHGSKDSSPSSKEERRTEDTSGMSFLGPYILCSQESMSSSESSDPCFSSLSSYDEENASISKSSSDFSPGKGVYVFSPPTFLPSKDDSGPPSASRHPSLSEPQEDNPPAYSPSPAGIPFTHPSGYCLMPRMDLSVAVWAQASCPTPESGREIHSSKTAEGDEHTCSYVTLSQPGI